MRFIPTNLHLQQLRVMGREEEGGGEAVGEWEWGKRREEREEERMQSVYDQVTFYFSIILPFQPLRLTLFNR